MPYSHILPYLLRGSLVQLRELGPPPAVLPLGYDANARCEFHSSAPGHSIEKCKELKYKVQDLIDSKAITFAPKGPNVNNNPMPPHNNASVNMMEADNRSRLMSCVDELKTPLIEIKNALMRDNAFPICSNDCEHCLINPQQCRTLKSVIQQLMDQGILVVDYPSTKEDVSTLEIPYNEVPPLQIPYDFSQLTLSTNHVTPIIITVPTPFSITRSGRIFAPTLTSIGTINLSTSYKGKQIDGTNQRQDPAPSNEVDKFLRIIKKSDYRVVDQFNETPSKISMLSLLILSLGFSDEELSAEGRNHNKALHISIECVETVLSRVLVDIGYSLTVMPKSSFAKLTVEELVMKPSELIVRAFDGTRRIVIGEVNLPMKIGPHTYLITFFVMDIYPAYSCLLGRPWIHSAGAVTSTFHQKLKFLADDKLVVVEGEEDIVVSHLASFRYVEGEGEMREIPYQSFEVINVEMVCPARDESKDAKSPTTSLKYTLTIIKDGHPQGWGRLLELPANKDHTGLGYNSQNLKKPAPIATRGSVLPLSENFSSVGYVDDNLTDDIAVTTYVVAVVDTVIQPVALQTSAPIIVETPNDNEDEYIGPTLHFCLPPRATQPAVRNLNQGVQIPPTYPGASSFVAPPFVYPGAPYAPRQN
ncbi:uncharacterized protein LOC127131593 [Lathyrus oleraceus]|uniref:uncharacterized protein LOC127131593 n=1 Tax=Pisum sativum TaxID=3888 RepID=UPI0021D10DE1|nr:uncharacterized protein LOC127131593 [Pisum sativum]